MKDQSLQELMRYGFAGGNFLIFFYWQFKPDKIFSNEFAPAAIMLGVSLLIGSTLYVLHRALPYPFFILKRVLRSANYYGGAEKWDKQWSEALESDPVLNNAGAHWGAQCHFLYVSSWSILISILVGWCTIGFKITVPIGVSICVALFYFLAAFVHNVRLVKFGMTRFESS